MFDFYFRLYQSPAFTGLFLKGQTKPGGGKGRLKDGSRISGGLDGGDDLLGRRSEVTVRVLSGDERSKVQLPAGNILASSTSILAVQPPHLALVRNFNVFISVLVVIKDWL